MVREECCEREREGAGVKVRAGHLSLLLPLVERSTSHSHNDRRHGASQTT
jgi:hypothetical protein